MRVQSKKFSSTFSLDFDGINSIVSCGLHAAVRSVSRIDNSRGIPDRIQVWLAPGCVGGVSLHQIIAAVQFHNPSR